MKKLFLPLLLIVSVTACKHKENVVEERYPDQSPKLEKTYLVKGDEKTLVGQKTFYPGNKVQLEGSYKNDKRDGRWVYYHSNGKPWSEGYFQNGKANGRRTTYYENGKVLYDGFYRNDQRVGIWKFYDNKGKLVRQIDFSRNPEGESVSDSLPRE